MILRSDRAEVVVPVESAESLVTARQRGKDLALRMGFTRSKATMIAAAISELARNIVQYAGRGEIRLHCDSSNMLYVIACDSGPGIADPARALEPGYSSSGGLGLGLPGVKRIAEEFDITSSTNGTTVIFAMKPCPDQSLIEIGRAQSPREGESVIGDRCVVKPVPERTLLAAIDGVGHGHEAARAAAAAAAVLEDYSDEPLDTLLARCHERLRETRGAAIMLTLLDAGRGSLQWTGVGNVAAVLLRCESSGYGQARELGVRPGIAGVQMASAEVSSTRLAFGDVVVLATDGLRRFAMARLDRLARPQALAERLLNDFRSKQDDALVVVARVAGVAA